VAENRVQTTTPTNPTPASMAENKAQTTTPATPTNTTPPSIPSSEIAQRYHNTDPCDYTPANAPTYLELVDRETKFRHTVNMRCFAIATIRFLHIAFGITITVLGASSSPHKIVTVFGVLNTATAVVPVVLGQRGLGPKSNNFREGSDEMYRIKESFGQIINNNGRPYTDIGKRRVYQQAVNEESYFRLRYHAFVYFGYLQIVIGLTSTALAATSSPHIVITVFGALNTVAAGVLSLTRGQVMPYRLRLEWQDFNELINAVEAQEGDEDFVRTHAKMRAAILEYM
jgi:diacylglycerol kinase